MCHFIIFAAASGKATREAHVRAHAWVPVGVAAEFSDDFSVQLLEKINIMQPQSWHLMQRCKSHGYAYRHFQNFLQLRGFAMPFSDICHQLN